MPFATRGRTAAADHRRSSKRRRLARGASDAALAQDLSATYKALGGGWGAPTEIAAGRDR